MNEQQRRLMQEALDENLTPESRQELLTQIEQSPEDSAEFDRLKAVDRVLRSAPFEHAPERLALNIMARIAEGLKSKQWSRTSGLALAVGLAMITAVMLPILVAAGWLFLSAVGSAEALNILLERIVGLLSVIVSGLALLVDSAQNTLADHPEAPALMLSLIPVLVFWVMRYTLKTTRDTSAGEEKDA